MNTERNIENKSTEQKCAVTVQTTKLQGEAAGDLSNSRVQVVGNKVGLLDTRRSAPIGTRIGRTDLNAEISVTVMVKSKTSNQEMDQTLQEIVAGKRKPLTDAEFNLRFGADPKAMSRVMKFAADNDLAIDRADANSGQIRLKGTVKQLSNAFDVELFDYKDGQVVRRERSGIISLPRELAGDVEGVFGLDNRKQAQSHFKLRPRVNPKDDFSTFLPNEVADLYNFPRESMGGQQSFGIVELGGGIDTEDNEQYYKDHNFKVPPLQIVCVDGAKNSVGGDADGEVALDVQIPGVIAPDANQQLIFAPNTDQGFIDAICRATFPEAGEKQNTAISISWGAPEVSWTNSAIQGMDTAFKKAALKGISVFAASGDNGAKDRSDKYSADYPSSDPYVTGCGGTRLDRDGTEMVWNDIIFGGGSTGGGISEKFAVPEFQKGTNLPANANKDGKPGRGDPDVAGDAAPSTGYRIRVGGKEVVVGGTSAVSPLYTGLVMRVNEALGHPAGYLNPFLYKKGNSGIFKDITVGNNDGYNAGPGWDATTGGGSINGERFLDALKQQEK